MAHLGTYKVGEITYDAHTGQAIAGADSVNTEFVEEYNSTYHEINLNDNPLISDDQPNVPNIFDARAKLYMNGDGEVIWTTAGTSEDGINDRGILGPKYYNFDKPNQENGNSFTNLGKEFFTKDIPNDEKVEHLKKVEEELTEVLNNEYEKRSKSNPNQIKPKVLMTKEELDIANNPGGFQDASNQELQERISKNYKGLHSSDRFLQRLSLKNLKYPIDADYGNTQDYIQINQFTYQATSPKILFGDDESINEFGNILTDGLKMGTPKEKVVGLVKLPMPNDLTDSNNVAWGEDQLNAITAAAATLASGGVSGGLKILEDIASKDINLLQGLSQAFTGTRDGLGKAVGQARTAFENNPDAELLGRSVLGSGLLNLAGFGLSPEAILARGAGIIPNSNLQLLFNAPTLRAFRFNWKMSPRSQEEATRINNIIRFFKQGMAVKKRKNSGPGGASYFLATPNVFDISFRTSKTNQEINNRNNSVLRMKTCACVGAAVNYTPQGMWNAYEKGQPTSSILSLQFKELEPVYNTDYEEDPFEYNNLTGFVPENGVGY